MHEVCEQSLNAISTDTEFDCVRQTLAWVWLVVNVISTDVTFDCVRQTVPWGWCETDSSVVLV